MSIGFGAPEAGRSGSPVSSTANPSCLSFSLGVSRSRHAPASVIRAMHAVSSAAMSSSRCPASSPTPYPVQSAADHDAPGANALVMTALSVGRNATGAWAHALAAVARPGDLVATRAVLSEKTCRSQALR
jgi:hypothetical protein